eukprot:403344256
MSEINQDIQDQSQIAQDQDQLSQIDTTATQIADLNPKNQKPLPVFDEKFVEKISNLITDCEQNESIKKVEAFTLLQSSIQDIFASQDQNLISKIFQLSLNNLDHPLNNVAVTSKSLVKKILHGADNQVLRIQYLPAIEQLKIRGYKSRFIGLNIIIDYVDPFTYLSENPYAVREIMESTTEAVTTGKYVINFFETLLKKAMGKSLQQEQRWFDIWINEYLNSLQSPKENIRDAVCSLITPIVIKINKNSLPYILSTLLTDSQTGQPRPLSTQTLDQILTLMKIARSNKMLIIDDSDHTIKLEKKCQDSLNQLKPELPDFKFPQEYLLKLVMSENFKTCLDTIEIVAMEVKATSLVSQFEFQMADRFIKHCLRTTFPEFRQKYIKAIKTFIIRLRTSTEKDIKKYVSSEEGQPIPQSVEQVISFLRDTISFIQENLYLDKPVEGALPLFEIMRIIIELFGDFEYKLRITSIYPPCHLLSKAGLLDSHSFVVFLLNSLKSTWTMVRIYSFDILCRYPDNYPLFHNNQFVNEVILSTALELANNPKAMLAEASAMFFKLLFKKCLKHLNFIQFIEETSEQEMQLQFVNYVLGLIKHRVKAFQVTLIKEGKKEALLHGLLSFFKHLFEDFKLPATLTQADQPQHFNAWRAFFKDLLQTCLQISQVCKGLISNNGLMSDAEGIEGGVGEIKVDCRGHPIKMDGMGEGVENEDYDNLILVGVWLAVKEDGLTLFNLLKWLDFPTSRDDDSKFIVDSDIHQLCDNFLDMLFNFKHRGAIEKAAETFSLFSQKLLQSPDAYYKSLPDRMLDQALEKITTENLSTILRRSAGIPPTIIAILRAEPISSEPLLLNKSLEFLLKLATSQSEKEDSKIHALNIMRFIFQDAFLRHDVQKYITPAMILATESFSSNSWSIRNSALMAFTALTKRILNNLHVQDQDLSRTRGLSVFDFLSKYEKLSNYFLNKLRDGLEYSHGGIKVKKEEKDKQDLVIFSILLLISRLIPSFQLVGNQDSHLEEEKKASEAVNNSSKFEAIQEYVRLIKQYGGNATYFVRKISAQALLPLIKFDSYISEIQNCFETLQDSLGEGKKKLRQNTAHGLFIRLSVFQQAYFQYRDITNKQLGPGHYADLVLHRQQEEQELINLYSNFESKYYQLAEKSYSRISIGLYVKILYKIVIKLEKFSVDALILGNYRARFSDLIAEITIINTLTSEDQILLTQICRLLIVLNLRKLQDPQTENKSENEQNIVRVFKDINQIFTQDHSAFVYTFLTQFRSFVSQIQRLGSDEMIKELCLYLTKSAIPQLFGKDEKYCKVIETLLVISFKLLKRSLSSITDEFVDVLFQFYHKLESNPSILSQLIKLLTLALRAQITQASQSLNNNSLLPKVATLLFTFSDMEHKEQVRIAVSKSLGSLLIHMKLNPDSKFIQTQENFQSYLQLLTSLILLLNDEQPDIRYYLCHNGLTKMIESEQGEYTIQKGQAEGGPSTQESIVVSLNDAVVQELLFKDLTKKIIQLDNPELLSAFADNFLLKQWILRNPYREHLTKNFEDKIFFFEPINKFYDLIWVKNLAYKSLLEIQKSYDNVPTLEVYAQNTINSELDDFYSNELILRQSSTTFESLAQTLMLSRLSQGSKYDEFNFENANTTTDQTDRFISNLIK